MGLQPFFLLLPTPYNMCCVDILKIFTLDQVMSLVRYIKYAENFVSLFVLIRGSAHQNTD